jgi:hypothetical protein
MEHPLPTGIFVEFDDWTEEDFDREIKRLQQRIKELEVPKRWHAKRTTTISCTTPMFVRWLKMVNTLVTCLMHLARRVKMMRTNHLQVGQFRVHMFERVG